MVDFTLANARSSRYGHAAHNLQSCERLSHRIADWGEIPSHDAYIAGIHQNHARKSGFWKRMQELGMAQGSCWRSTAKTDGCRRLGCAVVLRETGRVL